jgi:hypothetical protein
MLLKILTQHKPLVAKFDDTLESIETAIKVLQTLYELKKRDITSYETLKRKLNMVLANSNTPNIQPKRSCLRLSSQSAESQEENDTVKKKLKPTPQLECTSPPLSPNLISCNLKPTNQSNASCWNAGFFPMRKDCVTDQPVFQQENAPCKPEKINPSSSIQNSSILCRTEWVHFENRQKQLIQSFPCYDDKLLKFPTITNHLLKDLEIDNDSPSDDEIIRKGIAKMYDSLTTELEHERWWGI